MYLGLKKTDIYEAVPLVVLSIICLASIIKVNTSEYSFQNPQYIGLSLLAISIILFSIYRRGYKYVFGISLLLALVNLIGFTATIVTIEFFGMSIQLLPIPIILLFFWVNQKEVLDLLGMSYEHNTALSNSKINGFKKRFSKLTDHEIEKKLKQNLIAEAIEALQQLKEERTEDNMDPLRTEEI